MKFKSPKRLRPQNGLEQKSLHQFVHMLKTVEDSPTLIQRIAEDRRFFVYCAAILNPKGHFPLSFTPRYILQTLRLHHIDYEMLTQRLEPVAHALGITPADAGSFQVDYYKILGISSNAAHEDIKSAYRQKARQTHPDTQKGNNQKFVAIAEAYQVLSDHALRRQYDLSLKKTENWSWSETISRESVPPKKLFFENRTTLFILSLILFLLTTTLITDKVMHELSLNSKEPQISFKHQQRLTDRTANMDTNSEPWDNTNDKDIVSVLVGGGHPDLSTHHKEIKHLQNIGTHNHFDKEIMAQPSERTKTTVSANPRKNKTIIKLPKQYKKKDVVAVNQKVKPPVPDSETLSEIDTAPATHSIPAVSSLNIQNSTAAVEKIHDHLSEATAQEVNKDSVWPNMDKKISSEEMAERVNAFIDLYVKTYEKKNTEKFLSLFTANATENGQPISQKKPQYRQNFQNLATIDYTLQLKNYAWDLSSNRILLKGNFSLTWRKKSTSAFQNYHGLIRMTLVPYLPEATFQVEKLSYEFIE